MRILIVTPRYYPEQFSITNISEQFAKCGHQVTVLTGKPNYGYDDILSGYKEVREEIINNVRVIRINERPRKKGTLNLFLNYLSIFWGFKKRLFKIKEKFDVVISHNLSPIFSMRGIKKFAKKNKIPHVHYGLDLWPESLVATSYFRRKSIIFLLMKKYCKKLYSGCDHICFASPSTENYFKNYLQLRKINFHHIYQPCLTMPPSKSSICNHSYCNGGVLNLTYCGTVGRFHRLDLLVSAVSQLVDENITNFHVNIIGSGSELKNIINLVNTKKVGDFFTFHGRVPANETVNFYKNADVLYVPLENTCETSKMIPQKLIECLMYGRPILGMIVGDGCNLIKLSSKGNIISDQNSESLAMSIKNLLNLKVLDLFQTGKENREFFDNNKRFSLETVCNELLSVCALAISNKKAENS